MRLPADETEAFRALYNEIRPREAIDFATPLSRHLLDPPNNTYRSSKLSKKVDSGRATLPSTGDLGKQANSIQRTRDRVRVEIRGGQGGQSVAEDGAIERYDDATIVGHEEIRPENVVDACDIVLLRRTRDGGLYRPCDTVTTILIDRPVEGLPEDQNSIKLARVGIRRHVTVA